MLPNHFRLFVELLETTRPTATKAIQTLVDAGVLTENSGKRRDRNFVYAAYLDVLKTGTELWHLQYATREDAAQDLDDIGLYLLYQRAILTP